MLHAVCPECMRDTHKYACSSYTNGRACSNAIRVRRDKVEAAILRNAQLGFDPETGRD